MGDTQQLEYALTGLMEETLHFGTTGLCSIGKDGFTYLDRDKRLVLGTKESVDKLMQQGTRGILYLYAIEKAPLEKGRRGL